MSTRTVLIWLGVAIVLGVALVVILRGPSPAGSSGAGGAVVPGSVILAFDQALVTTIDIEDPDGKTHSIRRGAGPDQWLIQMPTSGSEPGPTWSVLPQRVRGALRRLSELRARAAAEGESGIGERFTTVTITLSDGSRRRLRLAERVLAGAGLAETDEIPSGNDTAADVRLAQIDSGIHEMFRAADLAFWRDTAALPGIGPEASRITIKNSDRTIALARLKERWFVRQPVSAPANEPRVASIIRALNGVVITDFLDSRQPDGSMTGLDAPVAVVTTETDAGPTSPAGGTTTFQLSVGGPADTTGKSLFASLTTGDGPPRTFVIDAAGLSAALSSDPIAYIAAPATHLSPADVGGIAFTGEPDPAAPTAPAAAPARRSLKRSLSNWVEVLPNGSESMLAEAQAKGAVDFLALLHDRQPASVVITAPHEYRRMGEISLLSLDDSPLDIVEIGVAGQALVARSGEVYRSYPMEAVPAFVRDWLVRSGAAITPVPAVAGDPTDPMK
ncbi:MAG: hypothetical protein KF745_11480 [Phycisphaeraceae bacterium]|nr:hypothetical protein [Phycisphaeraceae bacterium]